MRPRFLPAALTSLIIVAGCATGEGVGPTDGIAGAAGSAGSALDGGKTDFPGTGGISVSGGAGGMGGAGSQAGAASGGVGGGAGAASGGAPGTGAGTGSGGGTSCAPNEKKCGGLCVIPTAGVGCDPTACNPCPAISNAILKCTGSLCDFDCVSGYLKSGSSCVSQGGSGGSPGSGGSTGTGGGGSGCALPCDVSSGSSQFVCTASCLLSGNNFGLCALNNCCLCT
jgi:hypothetical protein